MKFSKKNYNIWKKAKKIIPGGNTLISKRPELFLPIYWPTYFSKAKGCFVWDLYGKKYYDFSLMGVGTNILGYSNSKIDKKIHETIKKGNISTLNCFEEVQLSRLLLKINKWADMVKFARSGGEANSISIRIARASTNKQGVAVCGYHGWHDWYLAANYVKKNKLEKYLLKGLENKGVPKSLKNLIYTFEYNDFDGLKKLINKNSNIGIIKMEVSRNFEPKNNFLKKIKNLCKKKKLILIFDECTSGFRETFGGIHKKYKVLPDIAIYGKALGNGYAITAVVGRKKYMRNAKKTFISSTFWSERIGYVAAIETLRLMQREKTWIKISQIGENIKEEWRKIFSKYNFDISISGLKSIPSFNFKNKNRERVTFITQEMLKKKYLAGNTIFASTAHKKKYLKNYFSTLDKVVSKLHNFEKNKTNIKNKILGPLKFEGFKRLN
mgnify:CR=1 FL=1